MSSDLMNGITPWLDYLSAHPKQSIALMVCVQLLALVALGSIIARFAGRRSAAAGHVVWATVIVCSMLLIPGRLWGPHLTITFRTQPHAPGAFVAEPSAARGSAADDMTGAFDQGFARDSISDDVFIDWDHQDAARSEKKAASSSALSDRAGVDQNRSVGSAESTSPAQRSSLRSIRFRWDWIAVAAYLFGVAMSLLMAVRAWIRLRQIARQGQPLSEQGQAIVTACAEAIGLVRPPLCMRSDAVSIPMTWGIFRARICLPVDFESLDESSQKNCLMHEMAHIARRDNVWSWVSVYATSLYWFHPAIYVAARKMKVARELATDDRVLLAGADRSRYASTLLELTARATAACAAPPAIAMASAGRIESRIRRILDREASRAQTGWRFRVFVSLTIAMAAALGFRVATTLAQPPQPTRSQSGQASDSDASGDSLLGATYYERMKSVGLAEGDSDGLVFTVRGTVRDGAGHPVPGALVVLRESSTNRISSQFERRPISDTSPRFVTDVFARTTTQADGSYEIIAAAAPEIDPRRARSWHWDVLAASADGQLGWSRLKMGYTGPEQVSLTRQINLAPSQPVSGRLLSADGDPIAGARVTLGAIESPSQTQYVASSSKIVDLNASSLQVAVKSDADGKFLFPSIPENTAANLSIVHPDHAFPGYRIVAFSNPSDAESAVDAYDPEESRLPPLIASPAVIQAIPKLIIRGRLQTGSGQPLPDHHVSIGSTSSYAPTDESGQFEWPLTEQLLRRHFTEDRNGKQVVRFSVPMRESDFVSVTHYEPLENVLNSKPVVLIAEQGVPLTGKVVCRQDGQGVEGVGVALREQASEDLYATSYSRTDAAGAFRFVAPKAAVVVSVSGRLPGYALPSSISEAWQSDAFAQAIDLSSGDPTTLPPFRVQRVPGRRVQVVDQQGRPVESATVTSTYLTTPQPPSTYRRQRDLAEAVQTDRNGYCTLLPSIRQWQDGEVRAEGIVDGVNSFGTARISDDGKETVKVILAKGWRVVGRVMRRGQPVASVRVRLMRRVDDRSRPSARTMRYVDTTTTDADGRYEFMAAAGEEYSVAVDSPVGSPFRAPRASYGKLSEDGVLRFSDMEFLAMSGPGGKPEIPLGKITGTVKDIDGTPIAGAQVQLQSYLGENNYRAIRNQFPIAPAKTDARGNFELKDMPLGRAQLFIYPSRTEGDTKFLTTMTVADVGAEGVEIVVDPSLAGELPRIDPVRIVPMQP